MESLWLYFRSGTEWKSCNITPNLCIIPLLHLGKTLTLYLFIRFTHLKKMANPFWVSIRLKPSPGLHLSSNEQKMKSRTRLNLCLGNWSLVLKRLSQDSSEERWWLLCHYKSSISTFRSSSPCLRLVQSEQRKRIRRVWCIYQIWKMWVVKSAMMMKTWATLRLNKSNPKIYHPSSSRAEI